jgi:predicted DNA-binding transcriptional regulator AlpA
MPDEKSVEAPQAALVNFKHLPDDAIARVRTVGALFACSVPTVWRWTKAGRLPAPLRVGGVTGWRVGDLRKILAGSR